MQQTNEMFCDYNKNLLSNDFLNNNNTVGWNVSNPSLTFNIDYTTDKTFVDDSLLISCNGGTNGDVFEFTPSQITEYSFTAPRNGKYIFSFKTLYEKFSFDTSLDCIFYLIDVATSDIVAIFNITLGNAGGLTPDTFTYDKWLTFFEEVELFSGHTYQLSGNVTIDNYYVPLLIRANFDGFKLEYIENRNQDIPSYYTKPQI